MSGEINGETYDFLLSFTQPIIDRIADIEMDLLSVKKELEEMRAILEQAGEKQ